MRDYHLDLVLYQDGKDVTKDEPVRACREALFTAHSIFVMFALLDPEKMKDLGCVNLSNMLGNIGNLGVKMLNAAYAHLERLEE
jgi:hypothetical protein